MKKISKDLMGANISLFTLLIIKRKDSYGYAISQELKMLSKERINMKEGTMYPILKKLEEKKFINSYWNIEESDRPRKYYKILPAGEKAIEELIEQRDFMKGIGDVLQTKAEIKNAANNIWQHLIL